MSELIEDQTGTKHNTVKVPASVDLSFIDHSQIKVYSSATEEPHIIRKVTAAATHRNDLLYEEEEVEPVDPSFAFGIRSKEVDPFATGEQVCIPVAGVIHKNDLLYGEEEVEPVDPSFAFSIRPKEIDPFATGEQICIPVAGVIHKNDLLYGEKEMEPADPFLAFGIQPKGVDAHSDLCIDGRAHNWKKGRSFPGLKANYRCEKCKATQPR
jgi:hypothetical protein